MGVIRIEKNKNFTVMSNYHLRDKTLSLRARGLLSTMLSLPEEWDYSVNGLAAICLEGVKAVRSGLMELEEKRYLKRERIHTAEGKFDYQYTVYEMPQPCDREPHTLKGHTVEGHTLNGTQINKEKSSTDKVSTEEEIKKKENATACQSDDIKTEFENLWSLYPKKQGKERAANAYKKARKGCPELFAIVEKGIKSYVDYIAATQTDMQYVKQGGTWFYQHCWEDDYTIRGNGNGQLAKYDGQDSGKKPDSYENYVMGIDL